MSGLPAERVVALLAAQAVPFSEISAHRATLEQAYLELTRDAAEYRAERTARAPGDCHRHCRPPRQASRAGRLRAALRAEWTKFRTVRGWVIGMIIAALVTVGIALLDTARAAARPAGRPVTTGLGCAAAGRAGR